MFGISGFELLIIAVFILLVFGPDKLPEVGKTIGNAVRMFKNAQADMERVIRVEMYTDTDPREVEAAEKARESAVESGPSKAAVAAWSTDEADEEEEDEE